MTTPFDKDNHLDKIEDAPAGFHCSAKSTNYPISVLVEKLNSGKLVLPDFQRDFVWGRKAIQSFLRATLAGTPILSIIFISDPNDSLRKTKILDGQQRLTSLSLFMNNKINLGKSKTKFNDLSEGLKQDFLNKDVQITHIEADKRFHAYLFRTYNRGGSPLNAIELRRSNYEDLDILFNLMPIARQNHEFISIFGKNTRFKGLHVLLRSLAMHHMYEDYQKPLEQFLDRFCNKVEDGKIDLSKSVEQLNTIIRILYNNPKLGKNSFRQAPGKPINQGLLDLMIHGGLLLLERTTLTPKGISDKLQSLHAKIVNEDNYAMTIALSQDTSGRESTISRMSLVEELLDLEV